MTVTNVLAPATDPGTFDLRVDAVVVRAAAANGESGALQVADGVDVTISELAADGQLSDYDTTIDCGGGPRSGTSLTVADVRADVDCTITNTRKAPAPPPGPPGPAIDTIAPMLTSASLTNTTFAVRPRGAAEVPVAARAKRGTVFRYTCPGRADCFHDQARHDRAQDQRRLPPMDGANRTVAAGPASSHAGRFAKQSATARTGAVTAAGSGVGP